MFFMIFPILCPTQRKQFRMFHSWQWYDKKTVELSRRPSCKLVYFTGKKSLELLPFEVRVLPPKLNKQWAKYFSGLEEFIWWQIFHVVGEREREREREGERERERALQVELSAPARLETNGGTDLLTLALCPGHNIESYSSLLCWWISNHVEVQVRGLCEWWDLSGGDSYKQLQLLVESYYLTWSHQAHQTDLQI